MAGFERLGERKASEDYRDDHTEWKAVWHLENED